MDQTYFNFIITLKALLKFYSVKNAKNFLERAKTHYNGNCFVDILRVLTSAHYILKVFHFLCDLFCTCRAVGR